MEKIDFTYSGGFPVKSKTFSKLQEAHFEILKALIGHFELPNVGSFIISGCQLIGSDIASGVMYINGDLCLFKGDKQFEDNKIAKITSVEEAAFKNGANNPVYITIEAAMNSNGVPYALFNRVPGVSEMVNQVINWNEIDGVPEGVVIDPAVGAQPAQPLLLDRIAKLEQMVAPLLNKGSLLLWNKPANQIPAGWQECTNFRGKMPVGMDITVDGMGAFVNPEFSPLTAGATDPGRTGGNKNKTLVLTEIPSHSHEVAVFANGSASGNADGHPDNYIDENRRINSRNSGGLPDGTTKSFSLLNPYRTVIFIEYTGA